MVESGEGAEDGRQAGGAPSESARATSVEGPRTSAAGNPPPPSRRSLIEQLGPIFARNRQEALEEAAAERKRQEEAYAARPYKSLSEELHRLMALDAPAAEPGGRASAGIVNPKPAFPALHNTWTSPRAHRSPSSRRATGRPGNDFAWAQEPLDKQTAASKNQFLLWLIARPSGERIRTLRAVLGWTQRKAAAQLRISSRTVIRHEQGYGYARCPHQSLLLRLHELEEIYADPIMAYLNRSPHA